MHQTGINFSQTQDKSFYARRTEVRCCR